MGDPDAGSDNGPMSKYAHYTEADWQNMTNEDWAEYYKDFEA